MGEAKDAVEKAEGTAAGRKPLGWLGSLFTSSSRPARTEQTSCQALHRPRVCDIHLSTSVSTVCTLPVPEVNESAALAKKSAALSRRVSSVAARHARTSERDSSKERILCENRKLQTHSLESRLARARTNGEITLGRRTREKRVRTENKRREFPAGFSAG